MKFVIFGLTISSSWGNGHATLWRGLCRALAADGHRITFFERDVPYYASARDCCDDNWGCGIVFYTSWDDIARTAEVALRDADVAIVSSYCPDAIAAGALASASQSLTVFYDMDTPVTLSRLRAGEEVGYIGPRGLVDYDLVLSFTGGSALEELRTRLGTRWVEPLYGHVDPALHHPTAARDAYRADLSYLGTYSEERQDALERLFTEPARARPSARFVIGGAQYPQQFPWSTNIYFVRHLPQTEHAAFFSSSRLTLNVTRRSMAEMGWCPSGRLFEAAACGTAIVTDRWSGLDELFTPGEEILVADSGEDILAALDLSDAQLERIGRASRERVLAAHTSRHRAHQLCAILARGRRATTPSEVVDA